jgi:hypothetical protein
LLGGFLSTPVFVALYQELRENDSSFTLWALLLSTFGAFGYILTGGYDLAISRVANGVAVSKSSGPPKSRIIRNKRLGKHNLLLDHHARKPVSGGDRLSDTCWGYFRSYHVGRLVNDSLSHPIVLVPGALSGIIANPGWFIWLGSSSLRRGRRKRNSCP